MTGSKYTGRLRTLPSAVARVVLPAPERIKPKKITKRVPRTDQSRDGNVDLLHMMFVRASSDFGHFIKEFSHSQRRTEQHSFESWRVASGFRTTVDMNAESLRSYDSRVAFSGTDITEHRAPVQKENRKNLSRFWTNQRSVRSLSSEITATVVLSGLSDVT